MNLSAASSNLMLGDRLVILTYCLHPRLVNAGKIFLLIAKNVNILATPRTLVPCKLDNTSKGKKNYHRLCFHHTLHLVVKTSVLLYSELSLRVHL